MTTNDILILLMILIGALIGIGVGVHLAFSYAANNTEDGTGAPKRKEVITQATRDTGKEKRAQRAKNDTTEGARTTSQSSNKQPKKENRLKNRIHNQEGMSFSEVDCLFSDEDHGEKLDRIMHTQDDAYNYLGQKK